LAVPKYDLTGPAAEGIRRCLAICCVPIGTLHLDENCFTKNKANVISIETVIISTNGHYASGGIIVLIRPEVGDRQCTAGTVYCLDAVAGIVIERPTAYTD